MTTFQIKEDRMKYHKDLIQSFREGELSKEFVDAYPEKVKQMIREGNVRPEEVKKARNVWTGDTTYYKD